MNEALKDAAQAVLDRWDSPQWEWSQQGPTADLMAALRQALIATIEAQTTRPAECDYTSYVAYCRALEAYCDGMGQQEHEPVSAQIRFCQPQKHAIDSGWGPWQQWKILAKTPDTIDSQGYLVDYRLLYAAPVQPAEQPKAVPLTDQALQVARLYFGHAPGFYSNQCAHCKKLIDMVDKRCRVCIECADVAISKHGIGGEQ